ncbi:SCP2 domain-containing protein [Shewanella maritima]|uniref:ubiquinone biosynthesis accessory factor UbiJ n=1 Tax=Shewanella maritima TaxID=2520507 RepID=UPI0037357CEE
MQVNHLAILACAAIETGFSLLPPQAQAQYQKQKALQGKVFCFQLSQLSWPIYFVFAKQIQVFSQYSGEVDVAVHADASTLYQVSEGANLTELIKQDKLKLEGDLQLLQSFSQFLQLVEFDFAEPLSKYIGDAPTHFAIEHGKWLSNQAKRIASKSWDHIGQLTTEEYQLAIHKINFVHFCDNIETLEKQTDDIAKRIDKIREKLTP